MRKAPPERSGGAFLYPLSGILCLSLQRSAHMANKEQKSSSNTKKEPKLNLKEKRLAKQEKKSKKD